MYAFTPLCQLWQQPSGRMHSISGTILNHSATCTSDLSAALSVFSTDLPLTQRIEYLSRAIMCAKSATSLGGSTASGEFLHELEEKMEVGVHAEQEEATGNILWKGGHSICNEICHLDLVNT